MESTCASVIDRLPYLYRTHGTVTTTITKETSRGNAASTSVVRDQRQCSYELPVEIGSNYLLYDTAPSLIRHHAFMLLCLFLRKPSMVRVDERERPVDELSSLVVNTFIPSLSTWNNDNGYHDDPVSGRNCVNLLLGDANPTIFTILFGTWYRLFYPCRSSINWKLFYETGELKLNGAAAASNRTSSTDDVHNSTSKEASTSTTAYTVNQASSLLASSSSSSSSSSSTLNNEQLLVFYERFIIEALRVLCLFSEKLTAKFSGLIVKNLVKPKFVMDDIRALYVVMNDMIDILDAYYNPIPRFFVDELFFRQQYLQARRAVVLRRVEMIHYMFKFHRRFSSMRDWLYVCDVLLQPLKVKFDMYCRLAASTCAADKSLVIFHTANQFLRKITTLSLHDLVVRYMLRKYFQRNVRYNETVDPYARRDVYEDNDVANFYVFLVNRCFGSHEYRYNVRTDIFQSNKFWRHVLKHIATVAPHTFVAQVFLFICPLYRGPHEIRIHDILDYVAWLCEDDVWYNVYTCSVIERLRAIEEQELSTHFANLYEQETLLFYILVRCNQDVDNERLANINCNERVQNYMSSHRNEYNFMSDIDNKYNYSSREDRSSQVLPDFNWKQMFDMLYDTSVYDGTIQHVCLTIRDFFRYIITGELFNFVEPAQESKYMEIINDLMASRTTTGKKRARASRGGGVSANEVPIFTEEDEQETRFTPTNGSKSNNHYRRDSDDDTFHTDDYNSRPELLTHTFAIKWIETNCTVFPAYTDILRKLYNFMNAICIMYNGMTANTGSADFMRSFRKSDLNQMVKNEEGFWKKDKYLRVYTNVFQDFDFDGFENSSRRPRLTSIPNIIIANCLSSVNGTNLNFLRVATRSKGQHVIWNLTTRRYEVAAPALLFLLSLDTTNWSVQDYEKFPNTPNPLVSEYVNQVTLQLNTFIEDAQCLDSLSMMLYSRLIQKKRIGEAPTIVSQLFTDRIARTMDRDMSSNTAGATTGDESGEHGEKEQIVDNKNIIMSDLNVASSCVMPQQTCRYVHFIIDREEFFRLSQYFPIDWVYEFIINILSSNNQSSSSSFLFVQLLLLVVQLMSETRFQSLLKHSYFAQQLADELIESSISLSWLRKRKRFVGSQGEVPSTSRAAKCTKVNANGGNETGDITAVRSEEQIDGRNDVSDEVVVPFVTLMERQLATVDMSSFVDDNFDNWYTKSSCNNDSNIRQQQRSQQEQQKQQEQQNQGRSEDGVNVNNTNVHEVSSGLWSLFVTEDKSTSFTGKTSAVNYVNSMLTEREFRVRIKRLLRDSSFFQWTLDVIGQLTPDHIQQIDDQVIRAVFVAYTYVVRFCADSPPPSADSSSKNDVPTDRCIGRVLRSTAPELLVDLHAFFPCRFVISPMTSTLSEAFTTWLENRTNKAFTTAKIASFNVDTRESMTNDTTVNNNEQLATEAFSFDELFQSIEETPVRSNDNNNKNNVFSSQSVHVERTFRAIERMQGLPSVYNTNTLAHDIRQSIVYYCLVTHVFCDLDLATTLHMKRLIVWFLYPGVDPKHCVIARGSSGSGKSQYFACVRQFLNSTGLLNSSAVSTGVSLINTELLPLGQNLLCQCDEPKRVNNEAMKLMISPVPIAARAMLNQVAQAIPILSKIVFTVNNMFQIVSDDGVLERLHSVFRVSHKYYDLVNEQTDMTRYNCGTSYNLSHQFTEHVYPCGFHNESFVRGLYHVLHHWSNDQTVRPDASYTHSDQIASMRLRSVLAVKTCVPYQVNEYEQMTNSLTVAKLPSEHRVLFKQIETIRDTSNRLVFVPNQFDTVTNVASVVLSQIVSSCTMSIARSEIYDIPSVERFFNDNLFRSVLSFHTNRFTTDFMSVLTDPVRLARFKLQIPFYSSLDKLLFQFIPEFDTSRLAEQYVNIYNEYQHVRSNATVNIDKLYFTYNSGFNGDRSVDMSVLPSSLDLNLVDLQLSLDPFVRFKRTFIIEHTDVPISRELLQKQLNVYVDEVNRTIEDKNYRVRHKDFFDRFETEFGKWRYRRDDNDEATSNFWCVRIRRAH